MKAPTMIAMLLAASPLGLAAAAAQASPDAPGVERIRRVVIYGNEVCPPSGPDEIVVCARKPETERYRVPQELRNQELTEQSWSRDALQLEYVAEYGIESCSTVGPGSFTGCFERIMQRWRAARNPAIVPPPPR